MWAVSPACGAAKWRARDLVGEPGGEGRDEGGRVGRERH